MRCTRCDRPAVPQSVGYTPQGLLVFGWCLECMHDHECTFVEATLFGEAAKRRRKWKKWGRRGARGGFSIPGWVRSGALDPQLASTRLRFLQRIALAIEACAGFFLGMGLILMAHPMGTPGVGPFPTGRPPLLVGGGIALAIMGALIWLTTRGQPGANAQPSPAKTGPGQFSPKMPPRPQLPRRQP